jgi:hypothetical protein
VRVQKQPVRGEITLLVGPPLQGEEITHEVCVVHLRERVEEIMRERQIDRKAALKLAARERGLTKREAYKRLISGP